MRLKPKTTPYKLVHKRVNKLWGSPRVCENCGDSEAKRYEWANLDGEYSLERSKWKRLCVTCHRRLDSAKYEGGRYTGHKHTEDEKKRISESLRVSWAKRRERSTT